MEGPQADIMVRSSVDGERGRIDSALSLPMSHSGTDQGHIRNVDLDDNHHDDIVEHLDVIGPLCLRLSSQFNV